MMNENRPHISYTLKLSELSHRNIDRAGAKAANLGELARKGFPVPDGFVLTTNAFDEFLAANAIRPDSSPEAVVAAVLPADVANALLTAAAGLGDIPLAVRSSGVAEDLSGASFAGQYETVLDVRGADALSAAVRRCWASVFSERVVAYRATQGQRGVSSMAVLVQRLVPAEAAGVAFTANPVTGDRAETVVSAVKGLGDRLVSGQVSPDEWLVKGEDTICQRSQEDAIDAVQARAVAELARRVEAHFGAPQDIEWAFAGGQLFLLQARPITALPDQVPVTIPVPVEPPPGFWQREASHAPQPHSPMNRSLFFPLRNAAMKHMFDEFSLLLETMEFREIGGWEYTRLVPLGGKDRPAPPAWLMPLLIRVVPQMRSRIKQMVEVLRSDKPGRFIRRWYAEWQPSLITGITELRDVDVTTLSDEALDEHIAAVIAFAFESADVHFPLHAPLAIILGDLAFTCRDLLGWDEGQTFELMSGLSEKSTEPARRLAELARMAGERPTVRRLLEHIDEDTARHLVDADEEFAAAFAAYQREFGCRALRYEVADPTVAETPAPILGLIRNQMVRSYDPVVAASALEQKRTATVAEARAALAGCSARDREHFEQALTRAEQAYPVREDNEFYTLSAPLALIRYAVLELGRRLTERGQLAQREDVFFLEIDEARAALRESGDQRALVARRKAERAWVEAHPGPATYGKDPGPPPSFKALPPEARLVMEALLWVADRIFAQEQSRQEQAVGATIRGIPVSPGQYTGPVRVIMNESEFNKLQAGDVLVCPITSPVWSVLFPSIGALVTDTGGILSHPAIIAREYRVPAVVATGNATRLLHDGQNVTVDGGAGVVEVQS